MARKRLLKPMEKRKVLYSPEVPAEEKAEWGRLYLSQDFVSDALAFFIEAKSKADLEKLRDQVVSEGDSFMLRAIGNAMPELVTPAHWEMLGQSATAKGKTAAAEQAARGGKVEMPVVDAVIKDDPTKHKDGQPAEDAKGKDDDEPDETTLSGKAVQGA